jgi:excisionase family DNA binding protein
VNFGPFDAKQAPSALVRAIDDLGPDVAITFSAVPALLTVRQAADVLGSSRHHVAQLIDTGALPAEFHGLHRRVSRTDVLALADRQSRIRTEVLDSLAELSRREGLYDEF